MSNAKHSSVTNYIAPGGGRELPFEKVGDGRRKIWIKPLKETNLGVVRTLFTTKTYQLEGQWQRYSIIFSSKL